MTARTLVKGIVVSVILLVAIFMALGVLAYVWVSMPPVITVR